MQSIPCELIGKSSSFTLMIAFIRHKLGLPAPDVSFMAAGRVVGWCAHAVEHGRRLGSEHLASC